MANELWQELMLRLNEENILLEDLPVTEDLLWGTLKELGFVSHLDRLRLCKSISASTEGAVSKLPFLKLLVRDDAFPPSIEGLLSVPGKKGLAAACRAAFKMATDVFENTQDTSLWLQMPRSISSIGANIQAYIVMQETLRKYHLRDKLAQFVSIALRDTLTLFIADVFPAFDDAFQYISCFSNVRPADMSNFRSQILKSRTSMARLALPQTDIVSEFARIYTVPLSPGEISDIHSAYLECAMRIPSSQKRKAYRPPKSNTKKTVVYDSAVPWSPGVYTQASDSFDIEIWPDIPGPHHIDALSTPLGYGSSSFFFHE